MQRGISLQQLAKQIEENNEAKADYIADTSRMNVSVVDRQPMLELEEIPNAGLLPIQPHAMRQMAHHVGVPVSYLDKMVERAPDLVATNFNKWLHLDPARRMVRTLHRRERAFMSDRYVRIDDSEVAETALPVLMDTSGIRIVSANVTPSKLYIEAVTNKVVGEVKKGDVVEAGVLISNSEIGMGSVSIAAITWRLICLNGAKAPDGAFKRHHVGRRVDEVGEIDWADDTRRADDKAILLKVRDAVKHALSEAAFKVRLDKMRMLATDAKITGDPSRAIEVLAKKVGLTDAERPSVLRALIEGADLSAWGVVNSVTRLAHEGDYDRAQELQSVGGQLIELPANQWREILAAA